MIVPFNFDTLSKSISVNIVNSDIKEFSEHGLEALYVKVCPRFITTNGTLYYDSTDHATANLKHDFDTCVEGINKKNFRDYVLKTPIFSRDKMRNTFEGIEIALDKNHLLLDRDGTTFIEYMKFNPSIISELEEDIGDKIVIDYVESTVGHFVVLKEDGFYYNTYSTAADKVNIKVTVIDDIYRSQIRNISEMKSHPDSYSFTGEDVRWLINRVPNVFPFAEYVPPFDYRKTKGIYNDDFLKIAQGLWHGKNDIYSYFLKLCKTSSNPKEAIDSMNDLNLGFNFVDFLVMNMGLDKVESQVYRTITTSASNLYERFFNYMIMDYKIVQLPKIIHNTTSNKFEKVDHNEFISTSLEREYESEVALIKKKVPYNERSKYLR